MSHLAQAGEALVELQISLEHATSRGNDALTAAQGALDAAQQVGSRYLVEKSETLIRAIQALQEHCTNAAGAMCEVSHALNEAVNP